VVEKPVLPFEVLQEVEGKPEPLLVYVPGNAYERLSIRHVFRMVRQDLRIVSDASIVVTTPAYDPPRDILNPVLGLLHIVGERLDSQLRSSLQKLALKFIELPLRERKKYAAESVLVTPGRINDIPKPR
jgi:hypothetical protein